MVSPAVSHHRTEDKSHIEHPVRYMLVAGFTLLTYDHLLTIKHEIAHIWQSKLRLVSVIFMFNRYLVPCILSIDIYEFFGLSGPHSKLFCKVWTVVQSYLSVASYMSIHALVAMRVHALYGGVPWLRKILLVTGSVFLVFCITITTVGDISITPHMAPLKHHCSDNIPSYEWMIWIPSLLFETGLFGLTISVAFSKLKDGQGISQLYMILFRDGILYFAAVFLFTLFSLPVWAAAPECHLPLARYFSLALTNVAGSRLVLNLKVFAAERDVYDRLSDPTPGFSTLSPSHDGSDSQTTLPSGSNHDYEHAVI